MKFVCKLYNTDKYPEDCKGYPWNGSNYLFPDCIFVSGDELLSEEEVLQTKTKEQVQEYCMSCGKCCCYWEKGKPIYGCSATQVVKDEPETPK